MLGEVDKDRGSGRRVSGRSILLLSWACPRASAVDGRGKPRPGVLDALGRSLKKHDLAMGRVAALRPARWRATP